MFCKHDYEKFNYFETKSEFEIIKENGYRSTTFHSLLKG